MGVGDDSTSLKREALDQLIAGCSVWEKTFHENLYRGIKEIIFCMNGIEKLKFLEKELQELNLEC